ncbi:MAG: hypothetical protein ABI977_07845 [Acidobacteriota bacterium]
MNGSPNHGEYRGIRYYRSPSDPELFYFLAAKPGAETDAQGRPTLLLLASGAGAILQLGSRWAAKTQVVEELRAQVAATYGLHPAVVRLQSAPLQIAYVALAIGDGDGRFTELQRNPSSGFAPLTAIFSAHLNAQQKTHAIAALGGRPGFLTVTWRGTLTLPGQAAQPIEAVADINEWFPSGDGLNHLQMVGATIDS